MTDDLEDRLRALFDRVAGTVTVAEELDRVRSIDPRRHRAWLPAVAAAVVVLAGVGAVVSITVGDDPDRSVSQRPLEPVEPLYVLPTGSMDRRWAMGRSGPHGSSRTAGSSWRRRTVTGSSTRSRSGQRPCPGATADPRCHPTRSSRSPLSPARRGEAWALGHRESAVGAASAGKRRGRGRRLVDAHSRVAVDGTRDLRQHRALRVAHHLPRGDVRTQRPRRRRDRNRGCTAGHPHRGWRHQTRTRHGEGVDAWHLSRTDVDGEWHGLAWLHAPFQVVYVTGHARSTRSAKVAESLDVVDEATWVEATGCDC